MIGLELTIKQAGGSGVSAQVGPRSDLAGFPPVTEKVIMINWHRVGKLALVGIGTFAAIWLGGGLLALLWAPTSSPARLMTVKTASNSHSADECLSQRGIPASAGES